MKSKTTKNEIIIYCGAAGEVTLEVDSQSNVQKVHIPDSDKPVMYFSLDIILAVGYR